jgi:hypothetical protein
MRLVTAESDLQPSVVAECARRIHHPLQYRR